MITGTCTRCGAEIGRTVSVDLMLKMFDLHDLHCPALHPAGDGQENDR